MLHSLCFPTPCFSPKDMDRKFLSQYSDLKKEKEELKERITVLESEIDNIKEESTDLLIKKVLLEHNKTILVMLELEIAERTNVLESLLSSIDDSYIRRIVSFRVIDGLSWADVTTKMGSGYTVDSIKKAFYRFFQ